MPFRMKLYNYCRSSASYRVRIGLSLKGLTFEYVPVHLTKNGGEQHAEPHIRRNRMGQVPVLEWEEGGKTVELTQSVAILEYLDDRQPEPPFFPRDPLARAAVRRSVEIVNSGIQPLQNLYLMAEIKRLGGDDRAFARAANERGLAALEHEAANGGGAFLVGDSLTLADVFLVPQMYSARRLGVDLSPYPKIVRIDATLTQIPAVAAAHPDRQPDAQ
ncbi:MAG TPA: maleylacetoacetate isomerase [Polyangiaceae bacterium]|jgi:maleylpyruvate isomerase|nr:maleylacetoacetate isomerase [Polyangiaceae bacterium]